MRSPVKTWRTRIAAGKLTNGNPDPQCLVAPDSESTPPPIRPEGAILSVDRRYSRRESVIAATRPRSAKMNRMELSQHETRYAKSNGVNVAYQVIGNGPIDLVFVMGWVSNIEYFWQEPHFARFLERLASFSRLILFDKRGTGLSDRAVGVPGLDERMDDLRAVMDAAGSKRAALFGVSEAGAMCVLFAATYPERTSHLVLFGCTPRRMWAPDFPWGATQDDRGRRLADIERLWGSPEAAGADLQRRAPSVAHNPWVMRWWSTYLRMSASPSSAAAVIQMNGEIDVRPVLRAVHVPTLVLQRTGDRTVNVEISRYIAERIPECTYVELPGEDHLPFFGDQDSVLTEIEQFLVASATPSTLYRVLLTVLEANVEVAPRSSGRPDDAERHDPLDSFQLGSTNWLTHFHGRLLERSGNRLLACFDGPARAIHCARALRDLARPLWLEARIGVHTGECEIVADRIVGSVLEIVSEIVSCTAPGDVAVSDTVKDLVAGSELWFEELGTRIRMGTSEERRIWSVADGQVESRRPEPVIVNRPAILQREVDRLTRREKEVAALVARGMTNRQIGHELTIAESTAERHVINILNKLGQQSRSQIAAWAAIHGLVDPNLS